MNELRNKVLTQYINQYLPTINKALKVLRENRIFVLLPYAQFLFSVADYFSLLYNAGKLESLNKYDSKRYFINFISSSYFPDTEHCKAGFLWFIRNGLVHQLFPKASGIGITQDQVLFFKSSESNHVACLNVHYFDSLLTKAIDEFLKDIKSNDNLVHSLHHNLINNNYGLNDFEELNKVIQESFNGDSDKIYSDCK